MEEMTEQSCLNAAYRFLSYRARSESETRERLLKRGFEEQDVEKAILQLRERGLLNDSAFARSWREDRGNFKPRGRRLLKMELRRKGVGTDIIDEVVAETDEKASALKAADGKARTLPVADYQVFRKRLGAYLQRRGFDYSVIDQTVKEAWLERTGGKVGESDSQEDIAAGD